MNLYAVLEKVAQKSPDATALIYKDKKTTYGELLSTIDCFSTGLARLGVSKGDKVALMMRNSPEFVITYYAVVRLGAVVVPLNSTLKQREVEYILANSGVIGAIVQASFVPMIEASLANLADIRFIISSGFADRMMLFEDIMAKHSQPVTVDVEESSLACILYTSGTTGKPKGAMLSHGNLLSNVSSCSQTFVVMPDDVFMCLLPMYHSFAWTCCVLLPLSEGIPTVIIESILAFQDIFTQIIKYRVSLFCGVPPIFSVMARVPLEPESLSRLTLRICAVAASPLPMAVKDAFENKFGIPLVEGYGFTEASPVVPLNPIGGENRAGSAGVSIPGVEVKIKLEDGSDATDSEVGEIYVRGGNVMIGYYNDPEATREALDENGWLHTGDIGRIQPGGYLEIVDRKKDMIIVKGLNVYSREVEDVLMMHPDVEECAVVGIPDEQGDELVKAFVTARDGHTIDKSELLTLCREHLASYKIPRQIIMTTILPKNSVGKILKRELRTS